MRLTILGSLAFLTFGCTADKPEPNDRQAPNPEQVQEEIQRAKLLEIAGKYKTFGRADGRMRWAPIICDEEPEYGATRPPRRPEPNHLISQSGDETTHGRKLYRIYATKFDGLMGSYAFEKDAAGKTVPVSEQVIVKESWIPEEVKTPGNAVGFARGADGKIYQPAGQGPLFVMYRNDPNTPGTDDGWVYGTLTPDGKTVTGVGRIESCMNCHLKAPHGRLFGLPND